MLIKLLLLKNGGKIWMFRKHMGRNLEETVLNAHRQIEEKDYGQELLSRGIPKEKIRHYGFAFEGKKVLIG